MFIGSKEEYKKKASRLSWRFHNARKEQGLTVTQLANRMGVRRSLIYNHENGSCSMNVTTLLRMCDAMGLKPESLLKDLN